MPIQLLALDLDGTLLNSNGEITERSRTALKEARDFGVRVALVTGRRFRDARPIALELGVDVPVIAHNGALTKHAQTLETVAVLPLPLEAARKALSLGRSRWADPIVSDDHEGLGLLVYDHVNGENQAAHKYINWAKRLHGEEGAKAIRQVESLEDYLDHDPIHLAFSGARSEMEKLQQLLIQELQTEIKTFCVSFATRNFAILDIVHPDASKGIGVAAAAAELGVSPEDVMAVGDNLNDLEMLAYAGIGIVMGNAEPALHDIEGLHVTGTSDEDGVAQAIDRFILGRR